MKLSLKSCFIGFLQAGHSMQVQSALNGLEELPISKWMIMDRARAQEMFANNSDEGGVLDALIKEVQKQLGGGMAEFWRDLSQMQPDQRLLYIDIKDLPEKTIEKLRLIMKEFEIKQAKLVGEFSVEHITFSPGHDKEMPLIEP